MPKVPATEFKLFGLLRGMVEEVGDIVRPATTAADWAATLEEWDEIDGAAPDPRAGKRRKSGVMRP